MQTTVQWQKTGQECLGIGVEGGMDYKETWKLLGEMEILSRLWEVSQVLTCVKADHIIYFKYVQSTVFQLYLNKNIKNFKMRIGSLLRPKPTIPNNGNDLY